MEISSTRRKLLAAPCWLAGALSLGAGLAPLSAPIPFTVAQARAMDCSISPALRSYNRAPFSQSGTAPPSSTGGNGDRFLWMRERATLATSTGAGSTLTSGSPSILTAPPPLKHLVPVRALVRYGDSSPSILGLPRRLLRALGLGDIQRYQSAPLSSSRARSRQLNWPISKNAVAKRGKITPSPTMADRRPDNLYFSSHFSRSD